MMAMPNHPFINPDIARHAHRISLDAPLPLTKFSQTIGLIVSALSAPPAQPPGDPGTRQLRGHSTAKSC